MSQIFFFHSNLSALTPSFCTVIFKHESWNCQRLAHKPTCHPVWQSQKRKTILKMIKWIQFNVLTFFDRCLYLFTFIWTIVSNAAIFTSTAASRVPSSCNLFFIFSLFFICSTLHNMSDLLLSSTPSSLSVAWLKHRLLNAFLARLFSYKCASGVSAACLLSAAKCKYVASLERLHLIQSWAVMTDSTCMEFFVVIE